VKPVVPTAAYPCPPKMSDLESIIPNEWLSIFEKAGITKEQLKDKGQLKLAKKFIRDNAGLLQASLIPSITTRSAPPPLKSLQTDIVSVKEFKIVPVFFALSRACQNYLKHGGFSNLLERMMS
jgi:hypothetical protein